MTYTATLATRPSDIDAGLRLRHDVYVNRMGLVPADHPYVRDGRLEDPYDARSHHLILRTGGQVVGTARFTCARDGALEIEEARPLSRYWLPVERVVEITRLMILKPHRCMEASFALFAAVLDAVRALDCRYLIAAGKLGSLGRYYRNMGLEILDPEPFEYPLIPNCQYQLLVGDFGRPGSLKAWHWEAKRHAVQATLQVAPDLLNSVYRRGLGTRQERRASGV